MEVAQEQEITHRLCFHSITLEDVISIIQIEQSTFGNAESCKYES